MKSIKINLQNHLLRGGTFIITLVLSIESTHANPCTHNTATNPTNCTGSVERQVTEKTTLTKKANQASNDPSRDHFFGGWGAQRFSNVSFVAPPSGVLPPTIFGTISNVNLDPVTLTFMVYEPNDRTNNYWTNDLFGDGVTFSVGATYANTIDDHPTTFNLTGTYSTKEGADLNDFLLPSEVEGGTRQGSYAIAFQFTHLLHQLPDNPSEGWGVYFKGTIADGNPNIFQSSVVGGIGGKGLFTKRPQDSFSLDFFYWNFSDDLQSAVNPVVNFGNEYGLEAYYSYAITPWLNVTGNVQYVRTCQSRFQRCLISRITRRYSTLDNLSKLFRC